MFCPCSGSQLVVVASKFTGLCADLLWQRLALELPLLSFMRMGLLKYIKRLRLFVKPSFNPSYSKSRA
jgi:hypothetical protein